MDVLNNARNNILDNFRSIKWLYHDVTDMKDMMTNLEDNVNIQKDVDNVAGDEVNTHKLSYGYGCVL